MGYHYVNMSIFNKKIRPPLLVVFLGTAIGALNGQFVWTLITALGLWALAYVAQNLSALQHQVNAQNYTTLSEADGAVSRSIERGPDWLRKWKEDMHYSPAYKGTPGNIWNGPKWTSDD